MIYRAFHRFCRAWGCVFRALCVFCFRASYPAYWLYIYYRQLIRFEPALRDIHFQFHKKVLEGQPIIMPLDIYPIFVLSMSFNTFLSNQYTEHNYNPLYIGYVNNLLNDLKYLP